MSLNLGAAIAHIASIRTELAQRTGCTEWDNAGIRAALITTEGAPSDVSAAACLAAGDPALKYPSEAAFRAHWPRNATAAPRVPNTVPCPDHGDPEPCPHPDHRGDMTLDDVREITAKLRVCQKCWRVHPDRSCTSKETP